MHPSNMDKTNSNGDFKRKWVETHPKPEVKNCPLVLKIS
jgi:hypothetical protein